MKNTQLEIKHKFNNFIKTNTNIDWNPYQFKKVSLIFNHKPAIINLFNDTDLYFNLNEKINNIYLKFLTQKSTNTFNELLCDEITVISEDTQKALQLLEEEIRFIFSKEVLNSYLLQKIEHVDNLLYSEEDSLAFYDICNVYEKSIYIRELLNPTFTEDVHKGSEQVKKLINKGYSKDKIENIVYILRFILTRDFKPLLTNNNYIASIKHFLEHSNDLEFNLYKKHMQSLMNPFVDQIINTYWEQILNNLKLLIKEANEKELIAFNKTQGNLNYYFNAINKKIDPFLKHCKVKKLTEISLTYENILDKYYEKRANSEFIPAGCYFSSNLIQLNTSIFTRFPNRYVTKRYQQNVMFHEFGHAVEDHWDKINFDNFLPHSKKTYKLLKKLKDQYSKQEHYSKFKELYYYCKPEIKFSSVTNKYTYNYKRSLSESFAESFGIVMSLYAMTTPELIKSFNRPELNNSCLNIKFLAPTILYILEKLELREVGFCKHNHKMRILFIRKFIHSIYNQKMRLFKHKIYYVFNNKEHPESRVFLKNIKNTKLKNIKV